MTIETTENRISYAGNGAQITFDFPYLFFEDTDLRVFIRGSDASETEKVLNTDFAVSGAGDVSGGTVTMVQAPIVGETLTIIQDPPITQSADFPEGGPLPSSTLEAGLDRLTIICQRLQDQINRTFRLSETSDPADLVNIEALLNSITTFTADIDAFGDVYLGAHATDPTTDNDGDPLQAGAVYFNTTNNVIRVYNGSAWNDITASVAPPNGSVTDQSISGSLNDTQKETFRTRIGAISAPGSLGNRQIFTTSGTFSKASLPASVTHINVTVWGAGGGGGGGNATASAEARGPGGGGGGRSDKRIAVSALANDETVTVGTGGAGGASGFPGTGGQTGGTSSFGSHCTAFGGEGGAFPGVPPTPGGSGGLAADGDLNFRGGAGGISAYELGGAVGQNIFGIGGDGALGGSGGRRNVGEAGEFPGGGGSGGNHINASIAGAGANGLVIVEW